MTWAPHVTVATIIERDDRFLMVYEEADGKKVYNQPAGHLDPNETLQEAAIRETLEETGWTVELTGVVRSEEHTSELQSQSNLVCRLLLEKKKKKKINI